MMNAEKLEISIIKYRMTDILNWLINISIIYSKIEFDKWNTPFAISNHISEDSRQNFECVIIIIMIIK